MTLKESFAPMRTAAFRWFFAGRAASLLGNAMAPIALAFAVLDLTGKASDLGLVLAARSIPMAGLMKRRQSQADLILFMASQFIMGSCIYAVKRNFMKAALMEQI